MSDNIQIHHLIPRAVFKDYAARIARWTNRDYHNNAGYNLLALSTTPDGASAMGTAQHVGSHPRYSLLVRELLDDIDDAATAGASDAELRRMFEATHAYLREG